MPYGEKAYEHAKPKTTGLKKENWTLNRPDINKIREKEYKKRLAIFKKKHELQTIDKIENKDKPYVFKKGNTLYPILKDYFKMNDHTAFLVMVRMLEQGINVDAWGVGDEVNISADGKLLAKRNGRVIEINDILKPPAAPASGPASQPAPAPGTKRTYGSRQTLPGFRRAVPAAPPAVPPAAPPASPAAPTAPPVVPPAAPPAAPSAAPLAAPPPAAPPALAVPLLPPSSNALQRARDAKEAEDQGTILTLKRPLEVIFTGKDFSGKGPDTLQRRILPGGWKIVVVERHETLVRIRIYRSKEDTAADVKIGGERARREERALNSSYLSNRVFTVAPRDLEAALRE